MAAVMTFPASLQVVVGETTTVIQAAAAPGAVGFEVLTDSFIFQVHPDVCLPFITATFS